MLNTPSRDGGSMALSNLDGTVALNDQITAARDSLAQVLEAVLDVDLPLELFIWVRSKFLVEIIPFSHGHFGLRVLAFLDVILIPDHVLKEGTVRQACFWERVVELEKSKVLTRQCS